MGAMGLQLAALGCSRGQQRGMDSRGCRQSILQQQHRNTRRISGRLRQGSVDLR